jgi:16S rRNA (cytidine1402-2'-O)-methyltransferase
MVSEKDRVAGTLYITATPIGNLEDITYRAVRILGEVDVIAAEDTRHSKKLLTHFNISTPLMSYFREKEKERTEEIIGMLLDGSNVALISDAGTPGISDPGAVLVNEAYTRGIPVVPVAGPSALCTALSVSGILESEFLFLGFAPSKRSQRRKLLSSLVNCTTAVVFYESPHRIAALFGDCLEILGDRQVFWARELTKKYEELQKMSLSELVKTSGLQKNRGESVVVIWPGAVEEIAGQTVEELLFWYRDNSELSLKDVSRKLAGDLGLSRSHVYRQALKIWNK